MRKKSNRNKVFRLIEEAAKGLYYMSETDAKVEAFFGGKIGALTKESFLDQIGANENQEVEEREFEKFFERLIKIQDWYGDQERETAKKYEQLRKVMKENLRELKVFRIGRIEIDIYVVGIDSQGNVIGVKTKAVET
jgi:hypothetical protein